MEMKRTNIENGKKQQLIVAIILALVAMVGAYISAYLDGEVYKLFFAEETYNVMVQKENLNRYFDIAFAVFIYSLYGLFLLVACGKEKLFRVSNFISANIVLLISVLIYVFGTYYMKNPLIYTPMMIFTGALLNSVTNCQLVYVLGRVLVRIKNR